MGNPQSSPVSACFGTADHEIMLGGSEGESWLSIPMNELHGRMYEMKQHSVEVAEPFDVRLEVSPK